MNSRIRALVIMFIVLFSLLLVNLTYLQIFSADSLINNRYNTRSINEELSIKRGDILTADGQIVARSKKQGRLYKRVYPFGEDFAHIVGYYDARLGRSGIEQSENGFLLGKDKLDSIQDYIDNIAGKNAPGNDIVLTIDSRLQTVAIKALGGRKGSVVLMNPNNGSIEALVSEPSYNPNNLVDKWSKLIKDEDSPLISRATVGLYPPGSSFKIISASAIIDSGKATPEKMYDAPGRLKIYGGSVTNYESHSYGKVPLETGFAKSINTVFARVGLELGQDGLVDYCEEFGFGENPPIEIDAKASKIRTSTMDDLEVAWTSVGQAGLLVTPLQMALAGSAVASKGKIYKPHIVQKIRDYNGVTIERYTKEVWKRPLKSRSAIEIAKMMRAVVKQGTGAAAEITGVSVAGKTGTAEIKGKDSHAWFIGFAPYNKPKYVVAVLVENGGKGGAVAAPIAKDILEAALVK